MQDSWLSKTAGEMQLCSFFADRNYMKKFYDALQTVSVLRAQEPPHFLVQVELVFWLTKKLS